MELVGGVSSLQLVDDPDCEGVLVATGEPLVELGPNKFPRDDELLDAVLAAREDILGEPSGEDVLPGRIDTLGGPNGDDGVPGMEDVSGAELVEPGDLLVDPEEETGIENPEVDKDEVSEELLPLLNTGGPLVELGPKEANPDEDGVSDDERSVTGDALV